MILSKQSFYVLGHGCVSVGKTTMLNLENTLISSWSFVHQESNVEWWTIPRGYDECYESDPLAVLLFHFVRCTSDKAKTSKDLPSMFFNNSSSQWNWNWKAYFANFSVALLHVG